MWRSAIALGGIPKDLGFVRGTTRLAFITPPLPPATSTVELSGAAPPPLRSAPFRFRAGEPGAPEKVWFHLRSWLFFLARSSHRS